MNIPPMDGLEVSLWGAQVARLSRGGPCFETQHRRSRAAVRRRARRVLFTSAWDIESRWSRRYELSWNARFDTDSRNYYAKCECYVNGSIADCKSGFVPTRVAFPHQRDHAVADESRHATRATSCSARRSSSGQR